ncbi:MAG TPA: enoyl-CoA hydratase-related protein [Candidatus Saccharimonadales bacterium]|nr:enoyl-CoA hydratase-related protein [Candidatus Saccharimonadales bacterium]
MAETAGVTGMEIQAERRGRVQLLTLNRPESLNALSVEMRAPLLEAFRHASRDDAVGAIVVTGSGRGFSSGGDITFMQSVMEKGGRWEDFRALVDSGRDLLLALDAIEKPVIAAVNGAAAGGGMSLALACDVRWASEKAKFAQSFVRIALHPDWGSLYTLPRMVGLSRALELMWTGDLVDAAEALKLGLVSRVLPPERLLEETMAFADRLAQGPALAIAEIKRSVRASLGYTLEQALHREIEAQERCWNSRDAREGFAAFLAKREPRFEGR